MGNKAKTAPHPLFEAIKSEFDLPSDAYLSRFLKVSAPSISKVRAGVAPITAEFILTVYDATGWSIEEIRGYIDGTNARKQSQIFSHDDS
jgi:DNA-binding transcriptional regulator YdaS (Cro superfamily)